MQEFTVTDLTRQEALLLWMRRKGLTGRELCEKLRLSPASISKYLFGNEIPSDYHSIMVNLGIPAEYLPKPVEKKKSGFPARRVLG